MQCLHTVGVKSTVLADNRGHTAPRSSAHSNDATAGVQGEASVDSVPISLCTGAWKVPGWQEGSSVFIAGGMHPLWGRLIEVRSSLLVFIEY